MGGKLIENLKSCLEVFIGEPGRRKACKGFRVPGGLPFQAVGFMQFSEAGQQNRIDISEKICGQNKVKRERSNAATQAQELLGESVQCKPELLFGDELVFAGTNGQGDSVSFHIFIVYNSPLLRFNLKTVDSGFS